MWFSVYICSTCFQSYVTYIQLDNRFYDSLRFQIPVLCHDFNFSTDFMTVHIFSTSLLITQYTVLWLFYHTDLYVYNTYKVYDIFRLCPLTEPQAHPFSYFPYFSQVVTGICAVWYSHHILRLANVHNCISVSVCVFVYVLYSGAHVYTFCWGM